MIMSGITLVKKTIGKSKCNVSVMTYIFMILKRGRSSRFDQILQAGFVIYDKIFRELNKLNIKSRINSDTKPSINALRVNRLKMSSCTSEELSCYEMTLKINNF